MPVPETGCPHRGQVNDDVVPGAADVCPACVAAGDRWLHLRLCLTCGHVGCCDNSKNRHATAHHGATGHPIVASYEPGETWRWCYVCRGFIEDADRPARG